MKGILFLIGVFSTLTCYSQANIEMNASSCGSGTGVIEITSGLIYDGYQWYSKPMGSSADFTAIPGATAPSFSFEWSEYDQTQVKVWVIYDNGVSYFSNTLDINSQNCVLEVIDEMSTPKIHVFLNRANMLFVTSQNTIEEIEIINLLGQKVLTQKSAMNELQIDANRFEAGIYMLSARSGKEWQVIKFVKSE